MSDVDMRTMRLEGELTTQPHKKITMNAEHFGVMVSRSMTWVHGTHSYIIITMTHTCAVMTLQMLTDGVSVMDGWYFVMT